MKTQKNGGMGEFTDYVADNTTSIGISDITLTGMSGSVPIFSLDEADEIAANIPKSRYVYNKTGKTVVQLLCANFPDNLTYDEDKDIELEAIFLVSNSKDSNGSSYELAKARFAMNVDDPTDWRIVTGVSNNGWISKGKYIGFDYGVDENFNKISRAEIPMNQYYLSCFDVGFYRDKGGKFYCVDNDNDPCHPYLVLSSVYEFDHDTGMLVETDISQIILDIDEKLGDDFEGYTTLDKAVNAYEQGLIKFVDNTWQNQYKYLLNGGYENYDMSSYTKFNLIDVNSEDNDDEIPELICTNDDETCIAVFSFDSENGFGCMIIMDAAEYNELTGRYTYGKSIGKFNIKNDMLYYVSDERVYLVWLDELTWVDNTTYYYINGDGDWVYQNNLKKALTYEEVCADIKKTWDLDVTVNNPISYPYDKDSIITAIAAY